MPCVPAPSLRTSRKMIERELIIKREKVTLDNFLTKKRDDVEDIRKRYNEALKVQFEVTQELMKHLADIKSAKMHVSNNLNEYIETHVKIAYQEAGKTFDY